jgi:hypothetical protein
LRAEENRGLRNFDLPPQAKRPTFTDSTVDEGYLSELAVLEEADPQVLAHRKADDLDARLAALEQRHSARILNVVSARARQVSQRSRA